MFWVKKKNPITQAIEDFAQSRRDYISTISHVRCLHDFVKVTGIQNIRDINKVDIDSYVKTTRMISGSEFRRIQAVQALNLFMEYLRLKDKRAQPSKPRGRPAKVHRNNDMVELRKQDYTYEAIAKKFKLNKKTVYEIVKRLEMKV